jgi:hypothetical protein
MRFFFVVLKVTRVNLIFFLPLLNLVFVKGILFFNEIQLFA